MRKLNKKQKIVAVGTAAVVGVVGAGAAYAYWTTSGSGQGAATTGAETPVIIEQSGSVLGLTPGGKPQALDFTIRNPANGTQYVSAIKVTLASVSKDGVTPAVGCSVDDFVLVQPNAINLAVPAGRTAVPASGGTIAMKETGQNQDACKGAGVNLTFATA
jgi:hypothetical protein